VPFTTPFITQPQQSHCSVRKCRLEEPRNTCSHPLNHTLDSAVSITTSYWLDNRGVRVRVPVVSRIFTSPCHSDRLWSPPNLLSNGYQGLLPRGNKRPGREAGRSPPTNAEVKKTWVYTSTSPYTFMTLCLLSKVQEQIYLNTQDHTQPRPQFKVLLTF
jgi:hypothetical protein